MDEGIKFLIGLDAHKDSTKRGTDFVACVGCRAVFHLVAYAETGDAQFKSDSAYAAGAYKKPGRR